MALKSVFGFFYRIGSLDYPVNYDPNLPFGFDDDYDVNPNNAVFKYSINDVENALVSCRTLVRNSLWTNKTNGEPEVGSGRSSDIMIVDSTGNYSEIMTEDISASHWTAAFKTAEFLHNNQSKVFTNPSSTEFFNWGDEMLSSDPIFNVPGYKKNSLSYTLSSVAGGLQGRLETVTFSIEFGTGIIVLFRLYFDADAFVERSDNIKYKVYQYEDIDEPSDQISPDEMREQVVGRLFEITHEGKYKVFRDYFIDKRISDQDDFVREQFFVLSTLNKTINDDVARLAIKQYLINRYNNDLVYLRYTYPSIFNENEIHLIPIYDNFSTIIQSESSSTNDLNPIYPLSLNRLNTELLSFGYNISPSHYDYKPVELFYVGPGSDWVPSLGSAFRYLVPIIAVELDTESGIVLPISARFPNFRPVYGSEEGGKASEFHSILVKLFEYLLNISTTLDTVFQKEYNVVIYEAGTTDGTNGSGETVSGGSQTNNAGINRKRVSFEFNEYLWLLYGP
jgi:hypothetical protein